MTEANPNHEENEVKQRTWIVSVAVTVPLLLLGCLESKTMGDSKLSVKVRDFTAADQDPIRVTVVFNKSVDRQTVIPGQSLILSGATEKNASGQVTWSGETVPDDKLIFASKSPWPQILSSTDRSFTVTLKNSIRAKDGSPLEQCRTGHPETEPVGDCILSFSIPG